MRTEKIILNWAQALFEIREGKTQQEQEMVEKKLIEIFSKRKKIYLVSPILKKLEHILSKENKIELRIARGHDPSFIEELKNNIKEILGKNKTVEVRIQKELIGGFRAKAKNFLIKSSVQDFLNELK